MAGYCTSSYTDLGATATFPSLCNAKSVPFSVVTNHMWLLMFKIIELNEIKDCFLVTRGTFQELCSCMWLVTLQVETISVTVQRLNRAFLKSYSSEFEV
jgi:hypothetical protein